MGKKQLFLVFAVMILVLGAYPALLMYGDTATAQASSGNAVTALPGAVAIKADTSQNAIAEETAFTQSDWLVFQAYPHEMYSWSDAEKAPPSDGAGNSLGVAGAEDDLMCWAAAASNVLEWTGWGRVVASGRNIIDSDEMFQHFIAHWTDDTGWPHGGWEWWFDGTVDSDMHSSVDQDGGGNFWPSYDLDNYRSEVLLDSLDEDQWPVIMQAAGLYLYYGCGVTLSIYQEGTDAGHAITLWGYRYDPNVNPNVDPVGYYKGIWVTDSDDSKLSDPPAPNNLVYYDLTYDGWYHLVNYGLTNDWYIRRVEGLQPFPNTAPTASIGGPYSGFEGSPINFTGSASDPDGNPLCYRWDFENDGTWDTAWSFSPEASPVYPDNGTYYAKLAVSDYMSVVYDVATVTVTNVAPTLTQYFEPKAVGEGSPVTFNVSAADPGTDDLILTLEISGQVWQTTLYYDDVHGSGTFSFPYTPDDNGIYTVNLTLADEDRDANHYSTTLFVDNVNPIITPFGSFTVDEGSTVMLEASVWDFGSDDLKFTWEFQDGPTITHTYYNNGSSPDPPECLGVGGFPFLAVDSVEQPYGDNGFYTFILTVEDDDGGKATYLSSVTVRNVAPTISSHSMNQPNPQFILPIVHTLTFCANATDPGSDDLIFFWNWGDGTPDTAHTYYNGTGPDPARSPEKNPMTAAETAYHAYAAPGDYTVTLIVSDDDGGTATTTMPVHVASATEANHIIDQYIQSLPNTAFKPKAYIEKAAFHSLFKAVNTVLVNRQYKRQYKGAIQVLYSIRSKTDGFVGGSKSNDWIAKEAPQREICHMIDDLITYLQHLV